MHSPDSIIMLRIQMSLSPAPPSGQGVETCEISDYISVPMSYTVWNLSDAAALVCELLG